MADRDQAAATSERQESPGFCGQRLVPTAAPCIRPEGHTGLHVPVTHADAKLYLGDWQAIYAR